MLNFLLTLLIFYFIDGVGDAHAGPLVAAIVAIGNVLGSLGIVGKLLLTIGLSIGQTLLQKALAKKNKPQDQIQGVDLEIKMGDDVPVSAVLGRYAVAGKRKYIGTWGTVSKTPNAYLVDVIEVSNLPVGGLIGLWINDKYVTLSTANPHADGRGYPIPEFRVSGNDYAWWKFYNGDQIAADQYLIDKFGTHPERPYDNSMVGYGCAYIILTFRLNQELFSNSLPNALMVVNGLPLYDLRKDSTQGGSGSHRWGQPETYEPSDNPFVQAYNIARGIYYGDRWFYGGQNVTAKRLPTSAWIAAMNACDVPRQLDDGSTQPMFRSGIEFKGENEPLAIIDYLRAAANGRICEIGGKLKPFAGELGAAEAAFTDADIIITESMTFEPFPNLDDIFNGVTATYPEPEEKWASKDAPPYYVTDLEAADGQRRLVASLQFPAAPYAVQVQALMRTAVEEGRRFRTHQFYLPPAYWGLEPGDVTTWTSNINGYDEKKFIVLSIEGELTYNQLVTVREVDPLDYSWSPTFEKPVVMSPVGPVQIPVQQIPGWLVEASSVSDGVDDRRPAIAITVDDEIDDLRAIKVQVIHVTSGEEVFYGELPYVIGETYSWLLSEAWTLPGEPYQVRGIQVPYGRRPVAWTPYTLVEMFELAFGTKDFLDDAITAEKIRNAAITADKIMNAAITELKLADKAVSTAKIALEAVTTELIANQAIVAEKLSDGAVTVAKFAADLEPVTIVDTPALPLVKSTTNIVWQDALYTWNGTEYVKPEAEIGPGSITATQIADGAISTPKLAANAVTADKVAANAITTGKIAAGAVTADQIAANAVTTVKLAIGDFANMITNPFINQGADGFDGWTSVNGSSVPANQISRQAGTVNDPAPYFIRIPSLTTAYNTIHFDPSNTSSPTIPCSAGDGYYIEMYIRRNGNPTANCGCFLAVQNSLGGANTYVNVFSMIPADVPTTWTKMTFMAKIPAIVGTTVPARFNIQWSTRNNGTTTEGSYDIAKPVLRKATGAVLIEDGAVIAEKIATNAVTTAKIAAGSVTATELASNSVTAIKIAAGTITGDKIAANTIGSDQIAANSITAKNLILTDFTNLIQNWDFSDITKETMDAVWTFNGGVYVQTNSASGQTGPHFRYTTSDSNIQTGPYSLVMDQLDPATSVSMYMSTRNLIPVTSGEILYWEAQVRTATTAATAGFYYRIYWYDRAQAALGSPAYTDGVANVGVPTNYSTPFNGKITVPAGACFARVRIYNHSTNTLARYFVFDRLVLRRANAAELIVDGGITADKLAANSVTATQLAANAVTAVKIAANAVTADKINVSNLQAISATLGSVNISSAVIGTLQVGYSNIVNGAVSSADALFSSSNATIAASGDTTLCTVTVAVGAGEKVMLLAMQSYTLMSNQNISATLYMRRGSTNIGVAYGDFFEANIQKAVDKKIFMYTDTPTAGTYNYSIALVRGTSGYQEGFSTLRFLSAIVLRR